jgi:hypothetical protein
MVDSSDVALGLEGPIPFAGAVAGASDGGEGDTDVEVRAEDVDEFAKEEVVEY